MAREPEACKEKGTASLCLSTGDKQEIRVLTPAGGGVNIRGGQIISVGICSRCFEGQVPVYNGTRRGIHNQRTVPIPTFGGSIEMGRAYKGVIVACRMAGYAEWLDRSHGDQQGCLVVCSPSCMKEQGSHWRAARVVLGELQSSGWSGWIRETCGKYA